MSDSSPRARLVATKLAALVREHTGRSEFVVGDFGFGAALMAGGEAWLLLDRGTAGELERGIGPAVAWALRNKASSVHVIADHGVGALARRAAAFRLPVSVWQANERSINPAVVVALSPASALDPSHEVFRDLIVAGGAVPIVEHGVLVGEVAGLEVCRVITDGDTSEPRLELGIGAHDRDAFQMLHGNRPDAKALAGVVQIVNAQRQPGLPAHPLNRLGAERAVRSRLIDEPALIGATHVRVAQPPIARTNLKDAVPCVAVASGPDGEFTVVCSVGVDLDVVPYATDARLATLISPCVVVVPTRDALRVQHAISGALHDPIDIVPLDLSTTIAS